MADEPPVDMRAVWQNQPVERMGLSLEDLRHKARRLQTVVLWRNVREYVAMAVAVAAFGYYAWKFHTPIVRAGALLSIAGTMYVIRQLSRRGGAIRVPADMARHTCLDFHRTELERQRDLLRDVWKWSLLPLVPGLAVFLLGLGVEPLAGRHWLPVAGTALACLLAFILVGSVNHAAARKLQQQIDALADLAQEP